MPGLFDNLKGIGELLPSAASAITTAIGGIRTAITGQLPPDKQAEVELKLSEMEKVSMEMQVSVNKIEAASSSKWVSGWRPYIGWILGTCVGVYFVPRFVAATVLWIIQVVKTGSLIPMPEVGIQDVIGLLGSMLGVYGARTVERMKGVQRIK